MTPRPKFNLFRLPSLALDEVCKQMSVLELIELSLTSTKTGTIFFSILKKMNFRLEFLDGDFANRLTLVTKNNETVLNVVYHLRPGNVEVFATSPLPLGTSALTRVRYGGCFLYRFGRSQAVTFKRVLRILFKFVASFHLSGRIIKDNFKTIGQLLRSSSRKFPVTLEIYDQYQLEKHLTDCSDVILQMKRFNCSSLASYRIRNFLDRWVDTCAPLEEFSIKSTGGLELENMVFGIRRVTKTSFEKVVRGKLIEKCYGIKREDGVKAIVYVDEETFYLINFKCLG